MAYLVSAYAIVLLALAGYLFWLQQRRAQLHAQLRAARPESECGATGPAGAGQGGPISGTPLRS